MPRRRAPRRPTLRGLGRRWRKLPPIPSTLPTAVGPVRVVRVPELTSEEGERLAGDHDWDSRTIRLDAGLAIIPAWLTLRHEWVHAVLADAGVLFPEAKDYGESLEERVCNAIAAAMVSEMLA